MPTREFRVDDFGAPDYPELVLATSKETIETEPDLVADVVAALGEGSREAVADPERALSALIASAPALERAEQRAQLDALIDAGALSGDVGLDQSVLKRWAAWDLERGIVSRPIDVDAGFSPATSKTRN